MDTRRLERKLRMGMVGGGADAFIGAVHRMAAQLDGGVEFVAGALSATPDKARASGRALLLAPDRNYGTWEEMLEREAARPAGDRIDFVSIVTPNDSHFAPAAAFAGAGFHVVCDKPMTFDLEEARRLVSIVGASGIVFALTHNYTGYPLVKEARHRVSSGELGEVVKIVVEYPQGWLLAPLERAGQKQAAWRTDPRRAGASCCIGDIGSHCENLAHYITGLEINEVCADLRTVVPGRPLDDDGNLLVRYASGAAGVLFASQISAGEENNLGIRVYGTRGALEWRHEEPNDLWLRWPEAPATLLRRGNAYLSEAARRATRLPAGHPEAFIEAFANVYRNALDTVRARILGVEPDPLALDFPTALDGARGMAFIETAVASARSERKWHPLKDYR
ncbi:MAG: Gfo/Idh/MocA family oxidoreductase [Planctomycetes bacterium]|nr:Gfo/Idh/MocA family oxidoreductase [Planctomycetota bacterium]